MNILQKFKALKESAQSSGSDLSSKFAEMEQLLEEQENRINEITFKYKALMEHSNDVIFCVDKNGYYKFVNHVFASTFEKTPDFFEGKSFWDIYPKEHADHRFAASSKLFETGEAGSVEVVVPLPDRTLYYLAKTNPVKDEQGKILLNLTYAIDITERKLAEIALQQSEARLQELNLTKDKFFSIIAHDLMSPFTTLLNFSEFLQNNTDDFSKNQIQEFAGKMHHTIEQTYALLENLLAWARLQTGKIHPHMTRFHASEIISATLDVCGNMATAKNIPIEVHSQTDPLLNADKQMMETILRNLVTNAIKFSAPGEAIQIHVHVDKGSILFQVQDHGIGMNDEELRQLFRLDKTTIRKGTASEKRSGLGLILCKEFIELQRGHIEVQSVPGEGTTFSFSLPCE